MTNPANETALARLLSLTTEEMVPEHHDIWPGVQQGLPKSRKRPLWRHALAGTRVGQVGLLGLLFATVAATTFAVAPAITRLFDFTEDLQTIDELGLVEELGLVQASNGYTVTLQRAYADANQVLIEYSIERPTPGGEESPQVFTTPRHKSTLSLSDGTELQHGAIGFGLAGDSDVADVTQPDGVTSHLLSYDAWPFAGTTDIVGLKFSVEVSEISSPVNETPAHSEPGSLLVPTAVPSEADIEFVKLFEFDLTLPVVPALEMSSAPQTVVASGVPIALERVVATPSQTRARIRFGSPTGTVPMATIDAAGGRRLETVATRDEENVWDFYFAGALSGHAGSWTLTVKPDQGIARLLPDGSPPAPFITEAATFRFEMADRVE